MDIIIRNGSCGCDQSLNELYSHIFMVFAKSNDHISNSSNPSLQREVRLLTKSLGDLLREQQVFVIVTYSNGYTLEKGCYLFVDKRM